MTTSMRRSLAPALALLLITACPLGPKDDDGKPDDEADGSGGSELPPWIPVIPATELEAPEATPDPSPVPATEVEAPGSGQVP